MYDAIVVGARCAGSSTAMLLARQGHRVLLVDRATFPSDTISTHIIWQQGMERLERWGLRDRVRATGCPPLTRMTMDAGPFSLTGSPPPADGVAEYHCCRRTVLDQLLLDAAVEAGTEVRQAFTVTELLEDDGAVAGIRGHNRGGPEVSERARIVIGADGLHSRVAKAVGAESYAGRPSQTCCYYTYFSGVDIPHATLVPRDGMTVGGAPTNDGLFTAIVSAKPEWAARFKADPEGTFWAAHEQAPHIAEGYRAGRREDRFHGTADMPQFFRKPYGAGWALVGDAGYHKDPITAQGISDAFRDAELLADAVHAGLAGERTMTVGLADYQRRRDESAGPMYEFTGQLAANEPPPPELAALFEALIDNQAQTHRLFGVFAGTVAVQDFFSPDNTGAIMQPA